MNVAQRFERIGVLLWCFLLFGHAFATEEEGKKDQISYSCLRLNAFDVEYELPCGLVIAYKDGMVVMDNFPLKKNMEQNVVTPAIFRLGRKDDYFFGYEQYAESNKKVALCSGANVILIDGVGGGELSVGIAHNKDEYLFFGTVGYESVKSFFRCP